MILFLVMCTFVIIVFMLMVVDDSHRDIHHDSRKGSYYEQCHRNKE